MSHVGWTLAYVLVELTELVHAVPTVMNWEVDWNMLRKRRHKGIRRFITNRIITDAV